MNEKQIKVIKMDKADVFWFDITDVWGNQKSIVVSPDVVLELYEKLGTLSADIHQQRAKDKQPPLHNCLI